MTANETTINQSLNKADMRNYRSLNDHNQWKKPNIVEMVSYKQHRKKRGEKFKCENKHRNL